MKKTSKSDDLVVEIDFDGHDWFRTSRVIWRGIRVGEVQRLLVPKTYDLLGWRAIHYDDGGTTENIFLTNEAADNWLADQTNLPIRRHDRHALRSRTLRRPPMRELRGENIWLFSRNHPDHGSIYLRLMAGDHRLGIIERPAEEGSFWVAHYLKRDGRTIGIFVDSVGEGLLFLFHHCRLPIWTFEELDVVVKEIPREHYRLDRTEA
ncbi:hypothetical protein ACLRDC_13030 [Gluconacetobacter sacchari]|uniref:hypothetical protein n=1 Tax=Gluconacetobacter sacchari TaxID=92759 RepID=UPI0039B58387